jgi:hypothetical protein
MLLVVVAAVPIPRDQPTYVGCCCGFIDGADIGGCTLVMRLHIIHDRVMYLQSLSAKQECCVIYINSSVSS